MTLRSKIWLLVVVLFTLANLIGAGMALVQGELLHTVLHVALLLLGASLVGRILARRVASY